MLPALGSAPMLEKWPGIGKGGRAWTRCDDRYGTGKFSGDPDQCFVCGYYRYRHEFVEFKPPKGEKPKPPRQEMCIIPKAINPKRVHDDESFCDPAYLDNDWLKNKNKFYKKMAIQVGEWQFKEKK